MPPASYLLAPTRIVDRYREAITMTEGATRAGSRP